MICFCFKEFFSSLKKKVTLVTTTDKNGPTMLHKLTIFFCPTRKEKASAAAGPQQELEILQLVYIIYVFEGWLQLKILVVFTTKAW